MTLTFLAEPLAVDRQTKEVEHTHSAGGHGNPSEMGHARHSGNNWPAEAKRRFRIITASFWYQLMFSSGNKPMTIADRWRLEIQKSPSTS